MSTNISRLIIFGDSLSDIGIKRETITGNIAALFGLMRTNQVRRYSDNRNWTDFIWEWAGGQSLIRVNREASESAAKPHLTWNPNSSDGGPLPYANYAEGGAMGAADRWGAGLGTFKEQSERYLKDLIQHGPEPGVGLYLIWFGLNDLVTNERKPTDMAAVASEMCTICRRIAEVDRNAAFLFGNLPNPQSAVRYLGKEGTQKILGFHEGSLNFGHEIARQINEDFRYNPAGIVDLYTPMDHVCRNLNSYGLIQREQPHGVEVRYGAPPKDQIVAFCTTTSDGAHPTEEVYKIIAQIWADAIREHFILGQLNENAEARFLVRGSQ